MLAVGVLTLVLTAVVAAATASAAVVVLVVRRVWLPRELAAHDRAAAERLVRDELTGLATRRHFVDTLATELDHSFRTEHLPTVVQVSLDRFKTLNDSFGRDIANQVLEVLAARIADFAAGAGAVAGRIGGDDFAVLATVMSPAEAVELADRLAEVVRGPVPVGGKSPFVTASLGVAVAPSKRSVTADDLVRRADIAAHRAKLAGRDRVALFDDSMQAEITARLDLETALHGAVERREMRLYHQPIVDAANGRLSGFEALIRWERGPDNIVSPIEFIPIAEENGVIVELGAWALNEALSALRSWIDQGITPRSTTMSVNVSPRQIADPQFPQIVRDALAASGVAPEQVWLEITETMMVQEPELAQRTLREVGEMGVGIALDDFGTGYSSLSLLQQFPIGRLKIDRAFVSGIAERANDRSLVRTIVAMGQAMGLDLVAEGIETVSQLELLREFGCDKAQGYLFSRPVPPEAIRSTVSAMSELAGLSVFQNHPAESATGRTNAPVSVSGPAASGRGDGFVTPMRAPLGSPAPLQLWRAP